MESERLRVAFLAGTLGQGGAEKQLLYQVGALRAAGADVRVFSLTRGEHHEAALRELGAPTEWIGRFGSPAVRAAAAARRVAAFRPHVVQAAHFFVNLYAAVAGGAAGALSLGAGRGDFRQDLADTGRWGRPLLSACDALVVNSHAAAAQAVALGRAPHAVHVLANVIDLGAFDRAALAPGAPLPPPAGDATLTLVGVGSMVPAKRFDLFIEVVAAARGAGAPVEGWLVGDGPDERALRALARRAGLLDAGIRFLGRRGDVPALLRRAGALLITSDTEGFPNVLLEAMAAGIPVVSTAAGDAARVVEEGVSGTVVPVGDAAGAAAAVGRLAADPALRLAWGGAGRARVERLHAHHALAGRLVALYREAGERAGRRRLAAALDRLDLLAPPLAPHDARERHPAMAGCRSPG